MRACVRCRESEEDFMDRVFEAAFGDCYDSEEEADVLKDEYCDAQDEVDKCVGDVIVVMTSWVMC